MILNFENYKERIEFAYNGEEAINHVKTAISENDPYRFHLILMDCNMPFVDGYEATLQIRQMFSHLRIPRSN